MQGGPSGLTFQQTLTNTSAFAQGTLPSARSTQNVGDNSTAPVLAKPDALQATPTPSDARAQTSIPSDVNQTSVRAQATPATPDDVRSRGQERPVPSVDTVDESTMAISQAPENASTITPAESSSQQLPAATPTAPVVLASDESLPVVEANGADDASAKGLPAPSTEAAASALPISSITNNAVSPIEGTDNSPSNGAAVKTSDAGSSTATAPINAAIGDASKAIKALPVTYEGPLNDSGRSAPASGNPQPETAQIFATIKQPGTPIVPAQATPSAVAAQGSNSTLGEIPSHPDSTSAEPTQSGIASSTSDSQTRALQVPTDPSDAAPTINPTELWVVMHSTRPSGNIWSPAAFTNSGAATEIVASTSTSTQLLGAQTILGTGSLDASMKHLAQPVNATTSTLSKTIADSNKPNRIGAQSAQPAAPADGIIASAALAIPVPVQQTAPAENVVGASSEDRIAEEAMRATLVNTSINSLPSQTQATPGPAQTPQPLTNPVVAPYTSATSNGTAPETDTLAASSTGISLEALGFAPQTASDEFKVPAGIVPTVAPANINAASTNEPIEPLPVASDNLSTISRTGGQPSSQSSRRPAQEFEAVAFPSFTTASTRQGDETIKPEGQELAPQLSSDGSNHGVRATTDTEHSGIVDRASQDNSAQVEGANASIARSNSDDITTRLAQSVAAAMAGQLPQRSAPLDLASSSRIDRSTTAQSQTKPMQVVSIDSSAVPPSSNVPASALQSDPGVTAATSSSTTDNTTAQTPTGPGQHISSDSSTIPASNAPTSGPSPSVHETDEGSTLQENSVVADQSSDVSSKQPDAISEMELWVGMHAGGFGTRSIREVVSSLPEQAPSLPATLQQTLAALSTQPETGFNSGVAANTDAPMSAQQSNSQPPAAIPDKAASSLSVPAQVTAADSNNDRPSDAVASASTTPTSDPASSSPLHTAAKPQRIMNPFATMDAAPPAIKATDAANPQAATNGLDGPLVKTPGSDSQISAEIVSLPVVLPVANDPPTTGGSNQTTRKVASRDAVGAVGAKAGDPSDSMDTKSSISAPTGAATSTGSSTGSQTGGQSAPHSAADTSQAATLVAKSADVSATPTQAVAMHTTSHGAVGGSVESNKDAAAQSNRGPEAAMNSSDAEDSVTRSSINTSKLMQTMSESEMRVGMHSSEFGNISIRTTVSPQQMIAQISTDHTDLGQAISAHAASVETRLGNDSGLRTLIEVNQQAASSSGNSGSSPQREQQAFVRSVRADSTAVPVEADVGVIPAALVNASNGYRLDIRA